MPIRPDILLGEIKYRPPTGTADDRMLAKATGKTEDGKPVSKKDQPQDAAAYRLHINAMNVYVCNRT
jgi:hypothetical protein